MSIKPEQTIQRLEALAYFVKPFLKTECANKNILEITIQDFAIEKIEEFEKSYNELLNESITALHHKVILMEQGRSIPNFTSLSLLTQKKQTEIAEQIDAHVTDLFAIQKKAFIGGEKLAKLDLLESRKQPHFFFKPEDFLIPTPVRVYDQSKLEKIQQMQTRVEELRYKKDLKKKHGSAQEAFKQVQNLDEVSQGLCQLQWLSTLSKQKNKPVFELTEEECNPHMGELKILIEKMMQRQVEKADQAFKELMEEESLKKQKPKGKKQTTALKEQSKEEDNSPNLNSLEIEKKLSIASIPQNPSPLDLLKQKVNALNHLTPTVKVHSHVQRWAVKDLEKIRQFEDFDLQKGAYVKRYVHMNLQELKYWKAVHHFSGIECLFSHQELLLGYSLPYQYTSYEGETKTGRYLFCTMNHNGKKELGFVFVGMDEEKKCLYHAMFEPYKKQNLLSQEIKGMVEKLKPIPAPLSENWNYHESYFFSLEEDQVIRLVIGKNEAVTFDFHPFFPTL